MFGYMCTMKESRLTRYAQILLIRLKLILNRFYKRTEVRSNENLRLKRQIKSILGAKIHVVFVCDRPQIWSALKSLCESCIADCHFQVTIVTVPEKQQLPDLGLNHQIYYDNGALSFFDAYPCKVLNGYNAQTGKWLDLQKLDPDYVFFQRPYNVCRPEQYHSSVVSHYSVIGYVHYAMAVLGQGIYEETYPQDFVQDVSLFFAESPYNLKLLEYRLQSVGTSKAKSYLTGYPRFDDLDKYHHCDSAHWNYPLSKEKYRVIWTPRWTTNEDNCHFFDYKNHLLNYIDHDNSIDFIFRPHPQTFLEFIATGEMSADEVEQLRSEYTRRENAKIDDEKEYLTTFYSSDVLITDISSIIADYFLTGKPIIYCHKTDYFNDFSRKLSEGFYWVRNWQELEETLNMLRSGNDPLKEKRAEIIKNEFYLPSGGAGSAIKEILKDEFYGGNSQN